MKIAIDANELTLENNTGVKIYTRDITKALSEIDDGNEYILYAGGNVQHDVVPAKHNFNLKISKTVLPFWTYSKFPREIVKDRPDVLFMPIQSTPFLIKPKNIRLVITVHDMAFRLFPEHFRARDRFLLNFHTGRAVKSADAIIVPSETTKNDILRFYGPLEKKITVIYHGVVGKSKNEDSFGADGKPKIEIGGPYILFVGTIQPRKNIIRLIEAYDRIKNNKNSSRRNLKLVICGATGWLADKIYKRAEISKFSKDIIFTGGVNSNELDNLYKNASVFVLSSFYEGFGLPVLEAMNHEIPCVVSKNSSLKEIAGDAALFVDPYSTDDITEKVDLLLANFELSLIFAKKGRKRASMFNWNESAKRLLKVFGS